MNFTTNLQTTWYIIKVSINNIQKLLYEHQRINNFQKFKKNYVHYSGKTETNLNKIFQKQLASSQQKSKMNTRSTLTKQEMHLSVIDHVGNSPNINHIFTVRDEKKSIQINKSSCFCQTENCNKIQAKQRKKNRTHTNYIMWRMIQKFWLGFPPQWRKNKTSAH